MNYEFINRNQPRHASMHHVKIFIMNVIKIDALLFLLTGYGRLYQKGV